MLNDGHNSSARSNIIKTYSNDAVSHALPKTEGEHYYSNSSVRPGSTRYKLLQDLRHTDLSNDSPVNAEDLRNADRKHHDV